MLMDVEQLKMLSVLETEKVEFLFEYSHCSYFGYIQMAQTFSNQMYEVNSKPTQLVVRVVKRLLTANMDIPELKTIKWTVRVVVSL